MASKATISRQRSAIMVVSAGETHRDRIGAAMSARYGEGLFPAVLLIIDLLIADLRSKTAAMVARDDAHEEELRDDPAVREKRDDAAAALYAELVEARRRIEVIFGPEHAAKLGFEGRTAQDPVSVQRLARTVVKGLEALPFPEPRVAGVAVDKAHWLAGLESLADSLDGLLERTATETREAEATLTAKNLAIEEFDGAFSRAADLISTLLLIAGEKELARRVRPSSRRPGNTEEVAEEAPANQPSSDAE